MRVCSLIPLKRSLYVRLWSYNKFGPEDRSTCWYNAMVKNKLFKIHTKNCLDSHSINVRFCFSVRIPEDVNPVKAEDVFWKRHNASKRSLVFWYLNWFRFKYFCLCSAGCSFIFYWTCYSGAAYLGTCHPSPSSADDHCGVLHDHPGDRTLDPILSEG